MDEVYKNPIVCPTITATTTADEYKIQMEKVASFAKRIQIDLADGDFAAPKTIGADLVWWPVGVAADIHIMYKNPETAVAELIEHKPHLIIIHAESTGRFDAMAHLCKQANIKIGIALLPNSDPASIVQALPFVDHILIFSGDLGKFGGHANFDLLRKVEYLKSRKPDLEIGWDGGINAQNVAHLVSGGVDVLNVGGYIQNADDPEKAFHTLTRIAEETGST